MTAQDVWSLVLAERLALVEDLTALDENQWKSQSLAAGWSIHDVAAHLIDNARTTPLGLVRAMLAARGDFDRQNQNGLEAARGANPAATLAALRDVATRRTGPPTWLAALESRLVEEIAHGEDIRRPLGIRRDYPRAALTAAIGYQARTKEAMGGAKSLADQFTLVADDADLRLGSGPELRGPALALLLALTGRARYEPHPAIEQLSGPGVEALTQA